MILGSCVSLVGIVGPILHTEPVFIALVEEGESGKSSILVFAGSLWGRHTDPTMADTLGFGMPWDSTEFHIEKEALAGNHTPMLLDESRAQTTDNKLLITFVTKQAFRLERGFEHGRGNASHRRRSTHVSMLATSNISIECASGNVTIDDALRGRWIEVPAPAKGQGMYEDLHGALDVLSFTDRLRTLARQHFGHAAREFITRLSAWLADGKAGLLEWAEERRRYFLLCSEKIASAGRSVVRVRQKFATLYIAGCLAVEFGILPLNRREVRQALLTCCRDHLSHVTHEQQKTAQSIPSALELLRQHVRRNLPTDLRHRLLPNVKDYDPAQSPGLLLHTPKHGTEFFIANSKLAEIVGGESRADELKHTLAAAGDIAKAHGTGADRFSVKRTVAPPAPKSHHRPNLIAIKAAFFGLGVD